MIEPDFEVYAPWRDEAFLEQFGGRKEISTSVTETIYLLLQRMRNHIRPMLIYWD